MHPLLTRVESHWCDVLRWAHVARARDVTTSLTKRSALVVAPHPDDETLGCGATIARLREHGRRVRVVIITDGRRSHSTDLIAPDELVKIRRAEAICACGRLGVSEDDVRFCDVEDGRVDEQSERLRVEMREELERVWPGEILSPSPIDRHPDHRAVAAVVRRASAEAGYERVMEYPVWFWSWRAWMGDGSPRLGHAWRLVSEPVRSVWRLNPVVVSARAHESAKRRALEEYGSQLRGLKGSKAHTLSPLFLRHFFREHELFFEHRLHEPAEAASGMSEMSERERGIEHPRMAAGI